MALTLTHEEFIALENEKFAKQTKANALLQSANMQKDIINKKIIVDNAFKKHFDYYNSIISNYDNERKAINGDYPPNPVNETDLQQAASIPPTGRLLPTPPDTNIIRLPEAFDNTILTYQPLNEINYQLKQSTITSLLTNGPRYNTGTQPTVTNTLQTSTEITPSSTQVTFITTDPLEAPLISVGNKFLLKDSTKQTLIEITSIISQTPATTGSCLGDTPSGSTDQATCLLNGGTWTPPSNYTGTFSFTFLEGTPTNIDTNATIDRVWSGYQNQDRINKNDATNNYNHLMSNLISSLQSNINSKIVQLNNQLTYNTNNDDPDKATDTIANINASKQFNTDYLVHTEIGSLDQGSTKGLNSLVAEQQSRFTQANSRVTEISTSYTTHTTNFFDKRYQLANNRANGSYGSIREIVTSQSVKDTMTSMAAGLSQAIANMNL